jgi:hypothetical protein
VTTRYLPKESIHRCCYCPYFKYGWFRWVYPLYKAGGCRKGNFPVYDCDEEIPVCCPLEKDP